MKFLRKIQRNWEDLYGEDKDLVAAFIVGHVFGGTAVLIVCVVVILVK